MKEADVSKAFASQVLGLDGVSDEEPPAGSLLARLRAFNEDLEAQGLSEPERQQKLTQWLQGQT